MVLDDPADNTTPGRNLGRVLQNACERGTLKKESASMVTRGVGIRREHSLGKFASGTETLNGAGVDENTLPLNTCTKCSTPVALTSMITVQTKHL